MITTILIVLVAVVVLIVIIAVLALRYLRADDSDTFDDIPDEPRPTRRQPEPERESMPAVPERRGRHPERATEARGAGRPGLPADARAQSRYRDRDPGHREASPERAGSPAGEPRREPAIARSSRPARAASQHGPESATSSWDSLSDVDYWAELAADRPQITPGAPAASSTGRRRGEPGRETRQPAAARPAPRGDPSGPLPRRSREQSSASQPSSLSGGPSARPADPGQTEQFDVRAAQAASTRRGTEAGGQSPDAPARRGGQRPALSQRPDHMAPPSRPAGGQRAPGPRPAQPSRPQAPATAPGYPNGRGPDDDPLTSPSFPAIDAADSRSYRTRRSAAKPGTSDQHSRPASGPGATSHQYIDYSSAPPRAASRPDSYPAQQPAAVPPEARQSAAQHQQAAPAANPYGSYVSQPQSSYAESAYRPAGYPDTAAPNPPAGWLNGHAAGPHAPDADWYAAPGRAGSPGGAASTGGNGSIPAISQPIGRPADGYLPPAGLGGPGPGGGSQPANGTVPRSYPGIDYSRLSYDDPVYPDGEGALAGYGPAVQYAAQYDQQGRGGQNPGHGPDGYQGYQSHGGGGR